MFSPMPRTGLLVAALAVLIAGCGEPDAIETYKVPKPPPPPATVRLLGAILEDGKDQWFFKLVGPAAEIEAHAKEFVAFVESLRFTGKKDDPVQWTTPPKWEKGPAKDIRFATFYLDPATKSPELTVFRFDQISGLYENVARWCRTDLGRPSVRESDLPKFTKSIKAGPHTGTLVDMTGPGVPKGERPMMGGGGGGQPKVGKPKPLPISYTTPAGWEETGPRRNMGIVVLTTFQVKDGDKQAEVQVTPLPPSAMSVLSQVNRWRDQVGLGPVSQADLDRAPPKKLKVAGKECELIDLAGPAKRQLVAWFPAGRQVYYVKMIGAPELVGQQREKFESFLSSIQFTGAGDE